jgi:sulfate adenylyltransferase subunit 1
VDGLRSEREQGITIDVAYRYFATPRRTFVLADTPGHVQYTRNTVTGASTAELAILLVDARKGVVEQTRRHAAVLALLGTRRGTPGPRCSTTWRPCRWRRTRTRCRCVSPCST